MNEAVLKRIIPLSDTVLILDFYSEKQIKNIGMFPSLSLAIQKEFIYEGIKCNSVLLERHYSIFNIRENKKFSILIKKIESGRFSNELFRLKKGDKVFINNYCSNMKVFNNMKKNIVFASGTGIAPFLDTKKNFTIFHTFKDDCLNFSDNYNKDIKYFPFNTKNISRENSTNRIEGVINLNTLYNLDFNNTNYYLTGNPVLMKVIYDKIFNFHGVNITVEGFW